MSASGERTSAESAEDARAVVLPQLVCPEGHVWRTALPASFVDAPCPDCNKRLERVPREIQL